MKKVFAENVEVSDVGFKSAIRFAEAFGNAEDEESNKLITTMKTLQSKFTDDYEGFSQEDAHLLRLTVSQLCLRTELFQDECFKELSEKLLGVVERGGKE